MSDVFLKLLNLSITASWLILAVILVRFLLKKAPKWISCVLWALVAVRLICPVSLESVLSLVPSSETVNTTHFSARPYIQSGVAVIDNAANDYLGSHYFEGVTVAPRDSLTNPINVMSIIWIIGIAVMLLYALISFVRLKKIVGVSVPVRDNILACDEVKFPFILGILKPLIYVPSSIQGETLDYVITHESAHIKRRDHWWKPFGFLLLAVYWFNPLCWLAYILLCRDIEMACDEKVIRDMDRGSIAAYSQALLDCSFPRKKISVCPLAFGEVGVKERVRSVLNYKKPSFWIIAAAVAACIAVGVCFGTNPTDTDPSKWDVDEADMNKGSDLIGFDIQEAKAEYAADRIVYCDGKDGSTLLFFAKKKPEVSLGDCGTLVSFDHSGNNRKVIYATGENEYFASAFFTDDGCMLMTYETDLWITSYSVRSWNEGEAKVIYSFQSTAFPAFYPLSATKALIVNPKNENGKAVIVYSDGKEFEAGINYDSSCNAVIAKTEDGFLCAFCETGKTTLYTTDGEAQPASVDLPCKIDDHTGLDLLGSIGNTPVFVSRALSEFGGMKAVTVYAGTGSSAKETTLIREQFFTNITFCRGDHILTSTGIITLEDGAPVYTSADNSSVFDGKGDTWPAEQPDSLTPTGYDSGKPQLAMIFYNGSLYEKDTGFFLERKDGQAIEVPMPIK